MNLVRSLSSVFLEHPAPLDNRQWFTSIESAEETFQLHPQSLYPGLVTSIGTQGLWTWDGSEWKKLVGPDEIDNLSQEVQEYKDRIYNLDPRVSDLENKVTDLERVDHSHRLVLKSPSNVDRTEFLSSGGGVLNPGDELPLPVLSDSQILLKSIGRLSSGSQPELGLNDFIRYSSGMGLKCICTHENNLTGVDISSEESKISIREVRYEVPGKSPIEIPHILDSGTYMNHITIRYGFNDFPPMITDISCKVLTDHWISTGLRIGPFMGIYTSTDDGYVIPVDKGTARPGRYKFHRLCKVILRETSTGRDLTDLVKEEVASGDYINFNLNRLPNIPEITYRWEVTYESED